MYATNGTKIDNFLTSRVFKGPLIAIPLEFSVGVRDHKCFYDGAIRWSKKV